MLRSLLVAGCLLSCGCSLLPEIAHQPMVHNPFPQLTKVAIAPFLNHSDEPTLNGDHVAMAYYNELQSIPGFEVIPPTIVLAEMQMQNLQPDTAENARRLAEALGADAIVIGAVTDYSPYYPPRLTMRVAWFAANPYFHKIPPGYGLPWGTPEEEQIPAPLVMEAEMALARAQLATQTPQYEKLPEPAEPVRPDRNPRPLSEPARPRATPPGADGPTTEWGEGVRPQSHSQVVDGIAAKEVPADAQGELPSGWPDPRGFIPPPPRTQPVKSLPERTEPVLEHTRTYNGHDPEVTEALASYYYFRDDARFGGWQAYLQRSDDFVRFCCHMHIHEMLSARGGAGETRVVWRWPTIR